MRGQTFYFRLQKVGHRVAQTRPFFDKLPDITDFGPLQQSQNIIGQD
jgi:hypothetical protein